MVNNIVAAKPARSRISENVLVSEGSSKCLLTLCILFVYAKMKCRAIAAPKELRYRSVSVDLRFAFSYSTVPQVVRRYHRR